MTYQVLSEHALLVEDVGCDLNNMSESLFFTYLPCSTSTSSTAPIVYGNTKCTARTADAQAR